MKTERKKIKMNINLENSFENLGLKKPKQI